MRSELEQEVNQERDFDSVWIDEVDVAERRRRRRSARPRAIRAHDLTRCRSVCSQGMANNAIFAALKHGRSPNAHVSALCAMAALGDSYLFISYILSTFPSVKTSLDAHEEQCVGVEP